MSLLLQFGSTAHDRVTNACSALQKGMGVILVDDEHRENEGDLIFSAQTVTVHQINQMIQDCSGIICLTLTQENATKLNLNPMVSTNTNRFETAFTVSIEAREGVTTGVSAYDRLKTIKTATNKLSQPSDLCSPGHIFPLVAKANGVLERRGHTEGSIDLLKIARLEPYAVICELMNKDGTMKRMQELVCYAKENNVTIVSVDDIYSFRSAGILHTESSNCHLTV